MTIPSAFEVVDQAGHAWPLSPHDYYALNGQLSLVFDEPLPPGHYSLLNSSSDGLKDLAGWHAPRIAIRNPCQLDSPAQSLGHGSRLPGYRLALATRRSC